MMMMMLIGDVIFGCCDFLCMQLHACVRACVQTYFSILLNLNLIERRNLKKTNNYIQLKNNFSICNSFFLLPQSHFWILVHIPFLFQNLPHFQFRIFLPTLFSLIQCANLIREKYRFLCISIRFFYIFFFYLSYFLFSL